MKRNRLYATTILGVLLTTSCATVTKPVLFIGKAVHIIDNPSRKAAPEAPREFKEALGLLENQKAEEALGAFEKFLNDQPTSAWSQVSIYHQGQALEDLGRWDEAAQHYLRVIAATQNLAPKLQAMALYRLSFCHEAVGDDQKTLGDLHDLLTRAGSLPEEVRSAELPARLAGTYARVGNFDEAVQYYKQAELGVAKLRREGGDQRTPDWLPQTLYYMGNISVRNISWEDFEVALRPLARSQIYLLEAAELGVAPWSEKAAKDLIGIYSALWKVIANPPATQQTRSVLEAREIQNLQWKRADLFFATIEDLRARSLATDPTQGSEDSRGAIKTISLIQTKLQALYEEKPAGLGLTKEALARKSGLRGRVITAHDDETLERRFLRSAQLTTPEKIVKPPKTLPVKVKPTKLDSETTRVKDPNL